jgi:hypothetical protein
MLTLLEAVAGPMIAPRSRNVELIEAMGSDASV